MNVIVKKVLFDDNLINVVPAAMSLSYVTGLLVVIQKCNMFNGLVLNFL